MVDFSVIKKFGRQRSWTLPLGSSASFLQIQGFLRVDIVIVSSVLSCIFVLRVALQAHLCQSLVLSYINGVALQAHLCQHVRRSPALPAMAAGLACWFRLLRILWTRDCMSHCGTYACRRASRLQTWGLVKGWMPVFAMALFEPCHFLSGRSVYWHEDDDWSRSSRMGEDFNDSPSSRVFGWPLRRAVLSAWCRLCLALSHVTFSLKFFFQSHMDRWSVLVQQPFAQVRHCSPLSALAIARVGSAVAWCSFVCKPSVSWSSRRKFSTESRPGVMSHQLACTLWSRFIAFCFVFIVFLV